MLRTRFTKILLGAVLLWSTAASAQQAWTTRQVNVRAGPDQTYPAVATLAPGHPVDVAGCLSDYSWCDVVFNNGYERGWVPTRRLQYSYGGRRVPLYDYSTSIGLPIVTFSLLGYWDNYYRNRSWYRERPRWYDAPHSNWAHDRHDWRDGHHGRHDDRHDRRDDRHHDRRDGQWHDQPRAEQLRQDHTRDNRGGDARIIDGRRGPPQGQAPQAFPAQPMPALQPRVERSDQPRNLAGRPDAFSDRPRPRETGQY